ncbi:MAG: hydrolase [Modestobacter sp.]|nr:hydrolase [Modestobacter sp.]
MTSGDLPTHFFTARDGARLAHREVGEGRPAVLLHGYFSTAMDSWGRPGHAATLAERGHRVLMPDLRAHAGQRPVGQAIAQFLSSDEAPRGSAPSRS